MSNLKNEILSEVYRHLSEIIGPKAVKLFKRRIEERKITSVPQIIFEVAGEIGGTYGTKGAYAVLRELGRTVARDLMNSHPKERWSEIFEQGLNIMGFAKGVERAGKRACICSCVFYPQFLEPQRLKPTEHPVCWIGWGFIEGFMKAFTGAKGVRFVERDFERQKCWFETV